MYIFDQLAVVNHLPETFLSHKLEDIVSIPGFASIDAVAVQQLKRIEYGGGRLGAIGPWYSILRSQTQVL